MCKPHKTGGADKMTPAQRQALILAEQEMQEARLPGGELYDELYDDFEYDDGYYDNVMSLQQMLDVLYSVPPQEADQFEYLREEAQQELFRRIRDGVPSDFRVTLGDLLHKHQTPP
jgi:hypothetical protein